MLVEWRIDRGMRCDLVAYSGRNLNGKRTAIRIFPGGSRRGELQVEDLGSLVIRAPHGTRVLLITEPGSDWERHPWRCVRLLAGNTVAPERPGGLPGVRIPALELLDRWDARRTTTELESSFRLVERLEDGQDWTFGRSGTLKGRIKLIRVEKEGAVVPTGIERVAMDLLVAVAAHAPERLPEIAAIAVASVLEALKNDGVVDAGERADRLGGWWRDLLPGSADDE
jgi:hypothetical protein